MDVAVKVMLFQGCSGCSDEADMARQLVLREAAVACSVAHPNVVATYHYKVCLA